MPSRPLSSSHPDYPAVAPVVDALHRQAGGASAFETEIPRLLRIAIDEVIDAPRTGRFTLSEISKTEKSYVGTKVEIIIQDFLQLPRGTSMDLSVDGVEVDIRNTVGLNWSIPKETLGHLALLVRESETTAKCYVGIVVVMDAYLNPGENRDTKRGLSKAGSANVWWMLADHPYPPNFWEILPLRDRNSILAAGGGTARIAALFEKLQRMPISRMQVQALAQQHDYMKLFDGTAAQEISWLKRE